MCNHGAVHSPLLDVSAGLLSIGHSLDEYFNSMLDNAEPCKDSKAEKEMQSEIGATAWAGTLSTAGWAWTTLGIPSDHLQAASRLITSNRERASVHRFAILSLLRVSLEVSALCWWLVDPKITARVRMQRTLLLQRWSLDQVERADAQLKQADGLSRSQKAGRAVMQKRIDELAEEHNLQRIRSGSRGCPTPLI